MNHHACTYAINTWQCLLCAQEPVKEGDFPVLAPHLAKDNKGFESEAFSELFELESKNFWFRSRNKLILWAIQKYFPACRSLLEIGCGTGYVLCAIEQALPNVKLYGSDIYTRALDFAAQRVPASYLFQMDATSIPFKKQFDLICAFDVLEHIEGDEQVLHNIYQAVRPGGGIIFTVPQHPSLWSRQDDYACHKRRYTLQELTSKISRAGFKIQKTTSFVTLLLPLMILSRYKNKHANNNFDPYHELRLSPVINFALEKILALERAFIKLGAFLPAGGSLLVIAKR